MASPYGGYGAPPQVNIIFDLLIWYKIIVCRSQLDRYYPNGVLWRELQSVYQTTIGTLLGVVWFCTTDIGIWLLTHVQSIFYKRIGLQKHHSS